MMFVTVLETFWVAVLKYFRQEILTLPNMSLSEQPQILGVADCAPPPIMRLSVTSHQNCFWCHNYLNFRIHIISHILAKFHRCIMSAFKIMTDF